MAKANLNRWVFQIPLEDVKSTREDTTLKNVCLCCGKVIKKEVYNVHLLTNGNLVSSNEDFGEEDQGFFPIGSDCARKLPNNFYFKRK